MKLSYIVFSLVFSVPLSAVPEHISSNTQFPVKGLTEEEHAYLNKVLVCARVTNALLEAGQETFGGTKVLSRLTTNILAFKDLHTCITASHERDMEEVESALWDVAMRSNKTLITVEDLDRGAKAGVCVQSHAHAIENSLEEFGASIEDNKDKVVPVLNQFSQAQLYHAQKLEKCLNKVYSDKTE